MNSYDFFIYEFTCFMNSYMFHKFIYEFGCTKVPDVLFAICHRLWAWPGRGGGGVHISLSTLGGYWA